MENIIQDYYILGLYTDDDMKVFVQAGYISADIFKKITNKDYVETQA